MLTSCLFLVLCAAGAAPSPTPAQELPTYFIRVIQDRTLFAIDEPAMITIRLGNQVESAVKSKKFPNILESIHVFRGDERLPLDPRYNSKALYKKVPSIGYGAHKDFRLNLRKYFPETSKGGIFRILYKDDKYEVSGKTISILNIPLPDLKMDYLVKTSMGEFTMRLDAVQTPSHTRNFALLVATQFYREMLFHRVEHNYVIQTGDPMGDGTGGSGFNVTVEKSPFLRHKKYAVGMARKNELDSADSQFYICLEEIKALDDTYTVFGKVISGFDVVDAIGQVPTSPPNASLPARPLEDVHLMSIVAVPAQK